MGMLACSATYLPACLPACLLVCLPACLSACFARLLACLTCFALLCLLACYFFFHLFACLPACLLACFPWLRTYARMRADACLRKYVRVCLSYIHTYLLALFVLSCLCLYGVIHTAKKILRTGVTLHTSSDIACLLCIRPCVCLIFFGLFALHLRAGMCVCVCK